MQIVMISIQPQHLVKILNKEKILEIRKKAPKSLPCKVVVYCTKSMPYLLYDKVKKKWEISTNQELSQYSYNGAVVAEFTLNEVYTYEAELYPDNDVYQNIQRVEYNEFIEDDEYFVETSNEEADPDDCLLLKNACLSFEDVRKYVGYGAFQRFYALRIDNLIEYINPKMLSNFYKSNTKSAEDFTYEDYDGSARAGTYSDYLFRQQLRKAPQSCCYIKELK